MQVAAEELHLHEPGIRGPFVHFKFESTGDWAEMEDEARKRLAPYANTIEVDQRLAELLVHGIPPEQRRKWWFIATGGLKLFCEVGDMYSGAVESAKSAKRSDAMYFGGFVHILSLFPEEVKVELEEFLHTVWFFNRDIEFCPFILPLSAFLLTYLEKPLAYLAMQSLINHSKDSNCITFFTVTRQQLVVANEVLVRLICWKYRSVATTAKKLNISLPHVTFTFIACLFVPFMSSKIMTAFLDAYMIEGIEFTLKIVKFFFKTKSKELAESETVIQFYKCISSAIVELGDPAVIQRVASRVAKSKIGNSLIVKLAVSSASKSFKQSQTVITSKDINSADSLLEVLKSESSIKEFIKSHNSEEIQHSMEIFQTSIHSNANLQSLIVPEMVQAMAPVIDRGSLLTAPLLFELRDDMPRIHLNHKATLIYSMDNGSTLTSLCECAMHHKSCILMVKTDAGTVGAFLDCALEPSRGYHGNPTSFVFRCHPYCRFIAHPPPNSMFVSVTPDEALFIGGPKPAIYIDKYLQRLVTAECVTFGSPALMERETSNILAVELYSLQ